MLSIVFIVFTTIGAFIGGIYGAELYTALHDNSTALFNNPNASTIIISVIAAYAAYVIFVPITNHIVVAYFHSYFEETIVTF